MASLWVQDTLLQCICNADVDAASVLGQEEASALLSKEERCDVLALRGLLACHILEHSLQMRHQVNYGVNRCRPCMK
jgi:hypothetical protein